MKEEKKRHTIWLTDQAWDNVESHYQKDNCSTKNEYIEKAVQFYSGYLAAKCADECLPRILAEVLEGKLDAFGKRMGHLLFKLSVEQDMMANLLASALEVDLDTLQKLQSRCVQNVKKVNGEVTFQDALIFQKGADA